MNCFNCDRNMTKVQEYELDDSEVAVYFCSDCHTQANFYADAEDATDFDVEWYYEYEGAEIVIDPTPESLAEAKAEYAEEEGATL